MTSLLFPFYDPNNVETKFLKQILPLLKENFDNAFVSITPKTVAINSESLNFLKEDSFFIVNENPEDSLIGDHFIAGYKNAVEHSKSDQILHLCYLDRIAFALLNYKETFLDDLNDVNSPTLFLRSEKAWSTHPRNYRAAESMVTEVGRVLFDKVLDFTWCHLSLTAGQLSDVLPRLTARDLVITSQLIFSLKEIIKTKAVDWLSWEDPFIFGKDQNKFKLERENDPAESEKRMGYILPEIKYLFNEHGKLIARTERDSS
ncbi:hypothetical protein A2316_00535 [Candidatus Falkowbacteria bacterium RIFOXYB2_FULL_38_15]|uniref:Uncharacterized protein n=1 Tax=Candidatus Falkowbacteria bacterium RIFOXYA2_FULL_38_12 TaxID=1797993 RepID=A0A1F5S1Z2_9BACT|nr:MAG: hypothetical protein A2257_04490 [Candidatus Falkowbacteria bacterium RIFOXYA2_FULL_38_12]OGF32881.1 MAG: hypothetical protein A2316_00535 [Candidatus Falkowbacteria bacterium RIFOXYB2_FULL_38_15]OGF44017.1 MAG: hypothetical protein A2555_01265 [Candidatus Falkowbacteria bacterium RIFOXYD2_FULL_39_16]